MKKKVLVFLGHTDKATYIGALADEYERGAREAGHEVRRINIGELSFDPILHQGYKVIQQLEPDLKMVQEAIRWCDHFTLFYPNWWATMPAILKGMFDRMWLPMFAFSFSKQGFSWKKLLKGRSASVIITMDTPPMMSRILFGDNRNEIEDAILGFAGFSPIKVRKVGSVKTASTEKRESWKRMIFSMGKAVN
ncbi:NAD(P)H-dependent oxidoreductase [Candidatus Parcubacteria bacterium]|nr:NAD(P)H-dependent oxidoreductase [Candidatus Parcubacteria bacterium]